MVKLRAPQGTFSMEWNGVQLEVKKGIVTAPDEALGDLFAHGCKAVNEKIEVVASEASQTAEAQ